MNQLAIKREDTKEPIHEYLVRCTNVGLAARTLNEILNDIEVSPQRERCAYEIWRKLVPSMAAMHVEVHDARPQSVHDLNAMLLASGLDVIEHTPEKTQTATESDGEGDTPGSDA